MKFQGLCLVLLAIESLSDVSSDFEIFDRFSFDRVHCFVIIKVHWSKWRCSLSFFTGMILLILTLWTLDCCLCKRLSTNEFSFYMQRVNFARYDVIFKSVQITKPTIVTKQYILFIAIIFLCFLLSWISLKIEKNLYVFLNCRYILQ